MNTQTVQDVRYQRLQTLLQECSGNQAELARGAATNPAYISQIVNHTKMPSGKIRTVGERLARKLEVAFCKPQGWMDTVEPLSVSEAHASYQVTEARLQPLLDVARQLSPEQLRKAVDILAAMAAKK